MNPEHRFHKPPLLNFDALLAIDTVHLAAGDLPWATFRQFYVATLGLKSIESTDRHLTLAHIIRRVVITRDQPAPGHLALLARNFSDLLEALRRNNIPHEILHSDDGLTRTAHLRDGAGNWIHLLEHRPL